MRPLPRFAILACLVAGLLPALAASSQKPQGYTLILVPDQYAPIQITHDLSRHYPVVLASYEFPGDAGAPNIHVFQEGKWLNIPGSAFASGAFLRVKPARTIVVGEDNPVTAALLNSAGGWNVSQVLNIPHKGSTELINQYGKYFSFGKGEWAWFADKYKLDLKDENANRRRESWYDQPYRDDREGALPPRAVVTPPASAAPARPRSASFTPVTSIPPAAKPAPPPAAPVAPAVVPVAPAPAPVTAIPAEPAPSRPAPPPADAPSTPADAPSTPPEGDSAEPKFQGWKKAEPTPAVPLAPPPPAK